MIIRLYTESHLKLSIDRSSISLYVSDNLIKYCIIIIALITK